MNIKKLGTMIAAATVMSLAVAGLSATAANAADSTPLNFYFADGGDGHILADGQSMNWSDQVLALPGVTEADLDTPFQGSSDATGAVNFISPIGQERTISAWLATGPQSFMPGTKDILQPNLTLSGFTNGNWAGVKAGGDYSIGFAWTINNGVGLATKGVLYRTIHVQSGGAGAWTFDSQAQVTTVAPAVTTQPSNAAVNPGATATFTAAASGTPAPTVQWKSSTDGTVWTDVSGATSETLTVASATAAQSGTKYQAVFTNSKGSATTDAATLTVNRVNPDQPTGSAANKVTIAAPVAGATTVTVPAGVSNANMTLQAWAWSDPTNLGQVTTDASGNAVVDISTLPAGAHTLALTQPGDAAFTVLSWGTFDKLSSAGDTVTDNVDLKATVAASDLWSLNAEKTAIDFGNVQRNQSATAALGKVTVVDDRNVLKGWNLDASWSKFTAGSDEIATSALTIAPKAYTGYALIDGVSLGTSGSKIAESTAVSTLASGALFDADLTFTAPKDAKVGEYHSTLTLTLTSK